MVCQLPGRRGDSRAYRHRRKWRLHAARGDTEAAIAALDPKRPSLVPEPPRQLPAVIYPLPQDLLGGNPQNRVGGPVADVPNSGNRVSGSGASSGILALPEPHGTNPWKEGSAVLATRAPKDCYINMAFAPGQTNPGGWGTFDDIPDVNYVRNNLAVTPEFKPEVGYVQRYLIPEGTPIQIGTVGSQKYNNVTYQGGGN